MQKTISTHLASTYQMLQCAFPKGIDEEFYLPLLSILYDEMSDRNLAQVIVEFTGREYHAVLNDVYRIGSMAAISPELTENVRQKLMGCNYEEWLASE